MNIEFSESYQPLFELLDCWSVINDPEFTEIYSKREQEYWLNLSKVDTVLISGGRDSGKSFALSLFNAIGSKDYDHRILYTRQTMSSTDNSITEALENRLEMIGYDGFYDVSNKIYSVKEGIGKISITGQKTSSGNQTAKLKSLEDFSIFETDEGEELESYESWNKVKRSMRALDVQCLSIISFNPPTREHWLFERFYESFYHSLKDYDQINGIRDNVLYIHTTYLDNIDNMADHNVREYEELRTAYEEYEKLTNDQREFADKKLKKQWAEYKYEILGAFKEVADGVIYEDWEIGEFNESLPYRHGLDFGFNDPDALTKVAVDRNQKLIYVKELYFKNNTGSEQLAQILFDRVGRTDLIIADAAQKRLIRDLWDKGLNIKRCKKGGGSVERGIKTIQGYTIIVDPESKNVQKALNNYVWHDKRSGVPRHDWSDLCDSFRYAAMDIIEY